MLFATMPSDLICSCRFNIINCLPTISALTILLVRAVVIFVGTGPHAIQSGPQGLQHSPPSHEDRPPLGHPLLS
jgi:hypothetical protein